MGHTYEYEMKDDELRLFRHPFQYLKRLEGRKYLEIYIKSWVQTILIAFLAVWIQRETGTPVFSYIMPWGLAAVLIFSVIIYSRRICKKAILYNMAVKILKETQEFNMNRQNVMMSVRVRGRKLLLSIKELELQ